MSFEDALQAVVAALIFGEDIGIAAGDDTGQLYPGGSSIVWLSEEARALLSRAESIVRAYEPRRGYGTVLYDLREVVRR